MINNILNSNSITLGRTLLALSTLSTLLFNSTSDLFPSYHLEKIAGREEFIYKYNFFLIFDNPLIPQVLAIVFLLIIIGGIFPRITCFIQTYISYSLFHSLLVVEGGDQINAILALLLIPICCLDKRLFAWKTTSIHTYSSKNIFLINAFCAVFFIKIQMAILYLNAGVEKLASNEWANGTAIYYWFNNNTFGANNFIASLYGFLFENDLSVTVINFGVILLEIVLFLSLVINQRAKYLLFLAAVIFHFFIIIVHGLPSFFFSMTAGLMLYLWNNELTIKENFNRLWKMNTVKA